MSLPLIHLVAGARPNFMKIAPLFHELKEADWCRLEIIHTGQHYDYEMSAAFFQDLGLPDPQVHLGVGSGSHARQTAGVLVAYEEVLLQKQPAWVVVVGDVNSTLACTLAAKKLNLKVAHLEAGLRSFDRTMPEEINRLVTDALADLLWTPSPDGDRNLLHEGVDQGRIERVGNIMIDSFELLRPRIEAQETWRGLGLEKGGYGLLTLHRPSNVDRPQTLTRIVEQLLAVSERLPLVFPVHPRTRGRLEEAGLWEQLAGAPGMRLLKPQGYIDFMSLLTGCRLALTDSGGIQEETTYLGIPCLTLRPNTERPITVSQGTNRLIAPEEIGQAIQRVLAGKSARGRCPELWDGHTAQRVAASLRRHLG